MENGASILKKLGIIFLCIGTLPGEKSPCQGAAYREKQSFSNPARRERQREKART